MSECGSEKKAIGVGDIAQILRKLDELKEYKLFSKEELEELKRCLYK